MIYGWESGNRWVIYGLVLGGLGYTSVGVPDGIFCISSKMSVLRTGKYFSMWCTDRTIGCNSYVCALVNENNCTYGDVYVLTSEGRTCLAGRRFQKSLTFLITLQFNIPMAHQGTAN